MSVFILRSHTYLYAINSAENVLQSYDTNQTEAGCSTVGCSSLANQPKGRRRRNYSITAQYHLLINIRDGGASKKPWIAAPMGGSVGAMGALVVPKWFLTVTAHIM